MRESSLEREVVINFDRLTPDSCIMAHLSKIAFWHKAMMRSCETSKSGPLAPYKVSEDIVKNVSSKGVVRKISRGVIKKVSSKGLLQVVSFVRHPPKGALKKVLSKRCEQRRCRQKGVIRCGQKGVLKRRRRKGVRRCCQKGVLERCRRKGVKRFGAFPPAFLIYHVRKVVLIR